MSDKENERLTRLGQLVLLIIGVPIGVILIYNGIEILFFPNDFKPNKSIKDYLDLSNLVILGVSMGVVMLLLFPYAGYYYSGKKKDERKNNIFIKVPKELRTAIHQYLLFFKDFVKTAKNKEIYFNIIQTKEGLIIQTSDLKKDERVIIQKWFKEYIDYVREDRNGFSIKKEGNVTKEEMDFLRLKLETQIATLKSNLKIAKMENTFLKEHNYFLQTIVLNFSKNKNVIHNQYIQDGNQQFADKIENK